MSQDPLGPMALGPPTSSREIPSEQDLSGALHEVSNALTVIIGWLDRAIGAPPEELAQALAIAHARALDGRDMARRAIGALSSSSVQQSLSDLLQEAILGVTPAASSANVHLVLQPPAHGTALLEDARVVLQILTNLLLNAIAFSPQGGRIHIHAQVTHGEAIIHVLDEGPGVAKERRAQLFQRGVSTRQGGAGIGLAYAHELAQQHGGDLTCEDSPQQGALFLLHWPCAATRSSTEVTHRPSVTLQGCKILLIEDDESITTLLDFAFSARGAEVITASDAASLTTSLQACPFDVVLFDWSPIAADPQRHLSAVREVCPTTPLIAISGSATIPHQETLAFCSAWVRKSFDVSELLLVITSVLATNA